MHVYMEILIELEDAFENLRLLFNRYTRYIETVVEVERGSVLIVLFKVVERLDDLWFLHYLARKAFVVELLVGFEEGLQKTLQYYASPTNPFRNETIDASLIKK